MMFWGTVVLGGLAVWYFAINPATRKIDLLGTLGLNGLLGSGPAAAVPLPAPAVPAGAVPPQAPVVPAAAVPGTTFANYGSLYGEEDLDNILVG